VCEAKKKGDWVQYPRQHSLRTWRRPERENGKSDVIDRMLNYTAILPAYGLIYVILVSVLNFRSSFTFDFHFRAIEAAISGLIARNTELH